MGLTIRWNQKNKTAKLEDFNKAVEEMKEFAIKNDVKIYEEGEDVVSNIRGLSEDEGLLDFVAYKYISFNPHKDSEPINVCYDITNSRLRRIDKIKRDDGSTDQWYQNGFFCKTQYAGFETHKKVVAMLKILNKYIPLEVYDESEYYETGNEEKARQAFGENMELILKIGGMLKNTFGTDKVVSSKDKTKSWHNDYLDHLNKEKNVKV